MKFRTIEALAGRYPVAPMCRLLQASRSGFYAWQQRPPSAREMANRRLKAGVFDNRSYLIERADGELSGIFIGLRKIQGDWYVYDIQGGSSDAYVRELLDMPRINASGK